MPPKKRAGAPAKQPPAPAPAPSTRRSKLAREHNITATQEAAIRDAFGLFARPAPDDYPAPTALIRASDARRVMIALGFELAKQDVRDMLEVLDPESEGWVAWEHFVAYAAVWYHAAEAEGEAGGARVPGGGLGGMGMSSGMGGREEVERAFRLFTGGAMRPIRLADLKRVAGELREEVDEAVLWDMVAEANGERRGSREGVGKGVSLEEFERVIKRAGVFG